MEINPNTWKYSLYIEIGPRVGQKDEQTNGQTKRP